RIPVRQVLHDPLDVGYRHPVRRLRERLHFARERDVARMTRPLRHDMPLDAAPEQGEVSDDIADLVTHELIGKAQLTVEHSLIIEHDRILRCGTFGQSPRAQLVRLAQEAKRPRWSKVSAKNLWRYIKRSELSPHER